MNFVYLVVLCPLVSFCLLLFFIDYLPKMLVKKIGIVSIFISMIITFYSLFDFLNCGKQCVFYIPLWVWISIDYLKIDFNFMLDGLSITMLTMTTSIGFLIHLFSSWYIKLQDEYTRFFSYMNLFIASMVLLLLADNLLVMYIGWEGVGLCSYLLVGFYYSKINSGYAAIKGFIITRIGDIFLILAIFFIYKNFGTLNFRELKLIFETTNVVENFKFLNYVSLFLLIAAIAKSAQVPLQTWLIDAMAGPTPASALIHSSTMVTAGVYLIARMNFLFSLSPIILYILGIISCLTIIMSCLSALVQKNIKCILAYSTMGQVGYMFLALAMKEWTLAINHLVTHAIFKTLLFLSAGAVIILLNNEKNIFNMGGLRKKFPMLYFSFLIGGASLASFPILTSGFYSKGNILFSALENNYYLFLVLGLLGSVLTSIYTFRMIFLVFCGAQKYRAHYVFFSRTLANTLPLLILILLSTVIFVLIHLPLSSVFSKTTPSFLINNNKLLFEIGCSVLSLLGMFISYYLFLVNRMLVDLLLNTKLGNFIYNFWYDSWGFNSLYNILCVNPYLYVAKRLKHDPINIFMSIPITFCFFVSKNLKYIHNGYLRVYVFSIMFGLFLFILMAIRLYK
ncbi:NADH dehydrogenase I chain L [Buchnera aphidicola str. Bp (Baizongia pistaciae)]|uniref:NADH-quinone oxidoreductase subunit L n=1 Tax=Buchnera aphidicola subsp. Baizongia pistaciae (strain Bp) TaxID=224915 RepID=NUOL_BUCBP|nr:NADH-quinone oxidoreductase subunit L [Buchnera aphidicola]Q89AT6.1 RecName: Full=NADH-quinone oxidoreductase subunit L; AltName: Full=NADH dehydrogenase I subunit L; AltName: Full=NDH-1 subunit L [Buchnera aphidicola str. Bp (Baizongia pistaciae)]AAO26887.1 NADH dehydrogenase I chain L [Buchnera aphidicola str. Bp (Baizongia pistaciae)]